MAYTYDGDLEFLKDCTDEELGNLADILIYDKDGSTRYTEQITSSPEYKRYGKKYSKYWKVLAGDLQKFGGNTVVNNLFRFGDGVKYDEILNDVLDNLKISYSKSTSVVEREEQLIKKIFSNMLDNMSEKERKEMMENLNLDVKSDYSKVAIMLAIQVAIKSGGVIAYQIALIVANYVMKLFLGRGLVIVTNVVAQRTIGAFLGPVGWAITGIWAIVDLGSAAKRVTIPATVIIAFLRKSISYRKENKNFSEQKNEKYVNNYTDHRVSYGDKFEEFEKINTKNYKMKTDYSSDKNQRDITKTNFEMIIYEFNKENSFYKNQVTKSACYGFSYNDFKDFDLTPLPKMRNTLLKHLSEIDGKKVGAFFMDLLHPKNTFAFTEEAIYFALDGIKFTRKISYIDILNLNLEINKLEIVSNKKGVYYINDPWEYKNIYNFLILIIKEVVSIYNLNSSQFKNNISGVEIGGTIFSNISNAATIYGMDKIVNNPQGHGYAAERANHIDDILKGKNAAIVGDNNQKNGPDRLVNGEYIQTKYCANANRTINQCFDKESGNFKYTYTDGNKNQKNMTIEVPKDQYNEAIKAMQKKIVEGKVPGVTDPNEAKNIVKEGSVTYQQAKNITKFGTVDGLKFDAKNGTIIATKALGISATVSFATSIWNGEGFEEALKNATYTGLKVGGISFITSILVSQLSRTTLNSLLVGSTDFIIKGIGPRASAMLVNAFRSGKNIYGAAAMKSASKLLRGNIIAAGVSFVVLSTLDVTDIFRSRISGAQLFKNLTNTAASVAGGTAGWVGGAAAGAAVGSAVPIIGTTIGGVVGGIAGAMLGGTAAQSATKAVLDNFIEDDAEEMIRIIKSVFTDLASEYLLNKNEGEKVADKLKNVLDGSKLKDMYASLSRLNFARNMLLPFVEDVARSREKIILPTDKQVFEEMGKILEEVANEEIEEEKYALYTVTTSEI